MKPYTILVSMKNGDVIVYDGWAKNTPHARVLVETLYRKNGWYEDVNNFLVHPNHIRKNPGFYQVRQIAGAA
jgi:hypothetical protein